MKVTPTTYTISDIRDMFDARKMEVNNTYQRNPGIWPSNIKSYFIDTILEGYPFPKIYVYESYNKLSKQAVKEVVDGQQRITTILSFLEDKFIINGDSRFKGKKFSTLDPEFQEAYLMYAVDCALITFSDRGELLEMFRRMNAYTVPLNSSEKRHAKYQGQFKWFINELAKLYSPLLEEYKILTSKQILRRQDEEFLTELAVVLERGIVGKSQRDLDAMYKKYDKEFPLIEEYRAVFHSFFNLLSGPLSQLKDTSMMKQYVVHSLFVALIHNKHGVPGGELSIGPVQGRFWKDLERALQNINALATAHEVNDLEGEYAEYVIACSSSTHTAIQRATRSKFIYNALNI